MKKDRDQLAISFLTCRTVGEVCTRHGISESTFYRIRKDPAFMAAVAEQKQILFHKSMMIAQAASLEAVEVLRQVAADITYPPSARVSAAGRILDMAQNAFDAEQLTERLNALERRLENAEKTNIIQINPRTPGGAGATAVG